MSTSPIAPAGSLDALAVVEVLTSRALEALGGGQQAVQTSAPSAEPPPPAPPQPPAAIAAATLQAASQQGGAAPLFADLAALTQSPGLPAPVVAAARQVLAMATPLDPPPSALDLRSALGQSGLLLEAHLAAGESTASDLKAALLNLQQALQTAIGQEPATPAPRSSLPAPSPAPTTPQPEVTAESAPPAPPVPTPPTVLPASVPNEAPETSPAAALLAAQAEAQVPLDQPATAPLQRSPYPQAAAQTPATQQASAQAVAPSPPYPDGPLRAQAPAIPTATLAADAPQNVATHQLLQDTTAALARQVLFQLASAPAAQHVGDPNNVRWLFELPLATPQGTAVAQFEIDRDGGGGGGAQTHDGDGQPAWRARFSLDLGEMGPIHVQISLGGGRAGVSLWAERPETAQALRAGRAELAGEFQADAVDANVAVFFGQPPAPAPMPRAGRLVDQAL